MKRFRQYELATADNALLLSGSGRFKLTELFNLTTVLVGLNEDERTIAVAEKLQLHGHFAIIYEGVLFPFLVGLALVKVPRGTSFTTTESTTAQDLWSHFSDKIGDDFEIISLFQGWTPHDLQSSKSNDYTYYIGRYKFNTSYDVPRKSMTSMGYAGFTSSEHLPDIDERHDIVVIAYILCGVPGSASLASLGVGYSLYYREVVKEQMNTLFTFK